MRINQDRLNDIAQAINERIPDGFGFIVMVWPLEEDSSYQYASNSEGKLKEILNRAGLSLDSLDER